MRRLFLILLACMALLPPAVAQATHRHATPCAACPSAPSHHGDCADHGCLGCSIAPDVQPDVAPRPRFAAALPQPIAFTAPTAHRPAFEPPPPRAQG